MTSAEVGLSYTELREMPLPELMEVQKDVDRIIAIRKAEAERIRARKR